jgi:DNA-binding PadR family transcriptional regulator
MTPLDPSPAEIELVLLAALRDRPLYGYAIAKSLSAESGGVIRLSPGVLYPLLRSLEKNGLVSADWEEVKGERRQDDPDAESLAGRKRKWYRLTPKGRRRLEQRIEAHRAHQRMIERFVRGLESEAAS